MITYHVSFHYQEFQIELFGAKMLVVYLLVQDLKIFEIVLNVNNFHLLHAKLPHMQFFSKIIKFKYSIN